MDGEAISNGFVQNPTLVTTGDVSNPPPAKKKRNLPGNPDPEAEVIALSPKTLMATNRFPCEICGKGFQRDQNLQLHRRGHNLPWKLKQRSSKEPKKRVYVCPEKTCVHNHPSRALGDLTGIKKHFCRKHGEKKWKCEKCSKRYAVQSDWKAHSKTCGTREYRCDCGTLFSRRDSFITHRAFCDALAEETARVSAISNMNMMNTNLNYQFIMAGSTPLEPGNISQHFVLKPISSNDYHHHEAAHQVISHQTSTTRTGLPLLLGQGPQGRELSKIAAKNNNYNPLGSVMSSSSSTLLFGDPDLVSSSDNYQLNWVNYGNKIASSSNEDQLTSSSTTSLPLSINVNIKEATVNGNLPFLYSNQLHQNSHQTLLPSANMSATALLQKAAQIGATSTDSSFLGSLGLKCNNTNAQIQVQVQDQDQNKFSGFYATSNTPIILSTSQGNIIDVEKSESDDQLLQMYSAKTKHLVQRHDQESAGGRTRDFLGVGIQTICQPSSINGWF